MAEEMDMSEREDDMRTIRVLMLKHGFIRVTVTEYGFVYSAGRDTHVTVLAEPEESE